MKQKNAPRDAHSRDWKMSQATALGAESPQANSHFDLKKTKIS